MDQPKRQKGTCSITGVVTAILIPCTEEISIFFKTTALRACRNSISPVKRHFKFHQVVWREETRASRFTLGVAICWTYGWRRGVVVPREKGEARKPLERSIRRDALQVETGTMEKRNGWTEFRVCSGTLVWTYRSRRPNDWEVTAVINVKNGVLMLSSCSCFAKS